MKRLEFIKTGSECWKVVNRKNKFIGTIEFHKSLKKHVFRPSNKFTRNWYLQEIIDFMKTRVY